MFADPMDNMRGWSPSFDIGDSEELKRLFRMKRHSACIFGPEMIAPQAPMASGSSDRGEPDADVQSLSTKDF